MPAMTYHLRWPDQTVMACYSPSLIVRERLRPGPMRLDAFLIEIRDCMQIASERVRAKYGFACSAAADQLAQIEATATRFGPEARIELLPFDPA